MSPRNGERSARRRAFRAKPVISRRSATMCTAIADAGRNHAPAIPDSWRLLLAIGRARLRAISAFERDGRLPRALTAAPRYSVDARKKKRKGKRGWNRRERFRAGQAGSFPAVVQRDELPRKARKGDDLPETGRSERRCDRVQSAMRRDDRLLASNKTKSSRLARASGNDRNFMLQPRGRLTRGATQGERLSSAVKRAD